MTTEKSAVQRGLKSEHLLQNARHTVARYERELRTQRLKEVGLRSALARQESLLRLKDEFIRLQEVLSRESAHRLWNDLQLVQSLLKLQSRRSANAETASQLAVAANRVATVGRVHRRLHSLDSAKTISFKHYLEELCCDFSTMLSSEDRPEQDISVEGIEIALPRATGIPLAFIVNELITNAVKYGNGGRIIVSLEPNPGTGYALSVCNDGPLLPEGFDPGACKGLGMKIIRSFLERIGGELLFGRRDNDQGARFTVLFS